MLRLTRIQRQGDLRKYCFEQYSRPDYLSKAVVIYVDAQFVIRALRFNSAAFGLVAYSYGRGMTESSAWEDETASRSLSTNNVYYSMTVLAHQPAIAAKVIEDVLESAPSDFFTKMVLAFVENTHQDTAYQYADFKLEPIQTTGQVRLLNYRKMDPLPSNHEPVTAGTVAESILKNLNPYLIVMNAYRSILDALNQIHYRCPACAAENRLLSRQCYACSQPRPKLKATTVMLYSMRALIDMSYFLYVLVALGFLIVTLFHRR
jgi:hypothetical protein